MTCTHNTITTWRFSDEQPAPLWSCRECGQRFEPARACNCCGNPLNCKLERMPAQMVQNVERYGQRMTRDQLQAIAKEVYGQHTTWHGTLLERLELLANKIAAMEREQCAQVCDDLIGAHAMARHCADAIRARNKQE